VLEAGAGIGALSGLLVRRERLLLVEEEPLCIPVLQQRFSGRDNVRIEEGCLTPDGLESWQEESLDTVVCSRRLERQTADDRALHGIFDLLPPGGHCILLLPDHTPSATAAPSASASDLLQEAGFDVVCSRKFDKIGRLFGGRLSPRLTSLADRFWPLCHLADWLLPISGQTLLVVGRKPGLALQRAAA
jgi:hypothetical protein